MRLFWPWLAAALLALAGVAQAQTSPQAKLLAEGHELALTLCSVCHVAAADQTGTPVMYIPGRRSATSLIAPRSLRPPSALFCRSRMPPPFPPSPCPIHICRIGRSTR